MSEEEQGWWTRDDRRSSYRPEDASYAATVDLKLL